MASSAHNSQDPGWDDPSFPAKASEGSSESGAQPGEWIGEEIDGRLRLERVPFQIQEAAYRALLNTDGLVEALLRFHKEQIRYWPRNGASKFDIAIATWLAYNQVFGEWDVEVTGKPGRPPQVALHKPKLYDAQADRYLQFEFRRLVDYDLGRDSDTGAWTYHKWPYMLDLDAIIGLDDDGKPVTRVARIVDQSTTGIDPAAFLELRHPEYAWVFDLFERIPEHGWRPGRPPGRVRARSWRRVQAVELRPSSAPKYVTDAKGKRRPWTSANKPLRGRQLAWLKRDAKRPFPSVRWCLEEIMDADGNGTGKYTQVPVLQEFTLA